MQLLISPEKSFVVGERVYKLNGDYTFVGEIRSIFKKKSGVVRLAVENAEGLLHIFSETQLTK